MYKFQTLELPFSFQMEGVPVDRVAYKAAELQCVLKLAYITLIRHFNQAIQTFMIKRQFFEIKLACRAIKLRLICIPRQLKCISNDPKPTQSIWKWSSLSLRGQAYYVWPCKESKDSLKNLLTISMKSI